MYRDPLAGPIVSGIATTTVALETMAYANIRQLCNYTHVYFFQIDNRFVLNVVMTSRNGSHRN